MSQLYFLNRSAKGLNVCVIKRKYRTHMVCERKIIQKIRVLSIKSSKIPIFSFDIFRKDSVPKFIINIEENEIKYFRLFYSSEIHCHNILNYFKHFYYVYRL